MESTTLRGRAGIVTGAASGIGLACAQALAAAGAAVVLADRDRDRGTRAAASVAAATGADTLFVATEVSRDEEVRALVAAALERHGRLDFAVNNAGIEGAQAPLAEVSEADWDRTIDVDLKGVWLSMRHELPPMLAAGRGAIVNTSSVGGLVALPGSGPYTAAKHGVIGLTKVAAVDYAPHGVRVNAICPGVIRTPMVERLIAARPEIEAEMEAGEPIGRFGQPEEIAAAVVWLCSDAASFVTGVALPVDGGYLAR
jgi:NAD(P)-dependent dehydrogenase (short-subunit alcohol dehydrogenase family)